MTLTSEAQRRRAYRSLAIQAANPEKFYQDRLRGMGANPSERAYLTRLRQEMSVARRTKRHGDYRKLRKEYDSYRAKITATVPGKETPNGCNR